MDVITLAMAKAYTDKKAIGGEESHVFKWDARNGTDGLTTNTAGTYAKISSLTPTAAELEGGILDIAGLIQIDLSVSGGTIVQGGNAFALGQYLVIATVADGEYPEPGIYISVGLALEMSGQENPFVTLQWETIHPIDRKYLPEGIGAKADIWEVSGVDEDQVYSSYYYGNAHRESYTGNFTDLLSQVKSVVEKGGQFIAYFPSMNFYAMLTGYSDTCVSFTSSYTDVKSSSIVISHWVFGNDGKLRSVGTKTTF